MKLYTVGEEIFNSVSHGIGAMLACAGMSFLLIKSIPTHNFYTITAASLYGMSLILLYLMSCLYHAITNAKAKGVLRIFDHSSIFVLITGSYLPILYVLLEAYPKARYIAHVLMLCTLVGIILNCISIEKYKNISMILYVIMGWSVVAVMSGILTTLQRPGIILLFLGGVAYTGGIFFYKAKNIRYMHSIWHLFVLAGSMLHYFCILNYIL